MSTAGTAVPGARAAAVPPQAQTPAAETAEPVAPGAGGAGGARTAIADRAGLEDLTDSGMKAIRDTTNGSSATAGLPQRAAPVASRPPSPSGSEWERPDVSEPAGPAEPAEAADPQWDSAEGDAYRPPPADTHVPAPGSGPRWRRAEPSERAPARSSSGRTARPRAGGRRAGDEAREAREAPEPSASDTGSFRIPAPPDAAWPADDDGSGWEAAGSDNRSASYVRGPLAAGR